MSCKSRPILGDLGSGYGIVAQALIIVVKAHDGHGQQTMLTDSILKALGLSSLDELIGGLMPIHLRHALQLLSQKWCLALKQAIKLQIRYWLKRYRNWLCV